MDELRRAAAALLDHPPLAPPPTEALASRNARRHRRRRAVLGVVAAAVVAGAVLSGGGGGSTERVVTAPTASDGGVLAVATGDGVALVSVAGGRIARVGLAGSVTSLEWSADGRWLAAVAGGRLAVVARAGGPARAFGLVGVRSAHWSPVAPILAVGSRAGIVTVRPRGRPHRVVDGGGEAVWSPDGRRLAYGGDDGLHVVDVDGTGDRLLGRYARLARAAAGLDLVGWSPDGRWLLYRGMSARSASLAEDGLPLVARGVDDGRSFEVGTVRDPDWVRWSPDGATLLVAEGSGRYVTSARVLRRCDLSVPRCTDVPAPAGRTVYDPAWSPDGRRIAFVVGPRDGTFADARAGARLWVSAPDGSGARQLPAPEVTRPAWTGTGAIVTVSGAAAWNPGGALLFVERLPVDGRPLRPIASLDAASALGLQGRAELVRAWAP